MLAHLKSGCFAAVLMIYHDISYILSYFMNLSCIDTIEVILSDWRDTEAGTTENLKSEVLLYIYSRPVYNLVLLTKLALVAMVAIMLASHEGEE